MVNVPLVQLLRTSFITTETVPGLLAPQPGQPPPVGPGLNSRNAYIAAFQNAADPNAALHRPWPAGVAGQGPSSRFWHYYLKEQDLGQVNPVLAWQRLVPLRIGSHRLTCESDDKARLTVEAYAYPHGTATIATVTLNGDDSLPASVDRVIGAQSDWSYAFLPRGNDPPATLRTLRAGLLTGARKLVAGSKAATDESHIDRFTLTTAIRTLNVDPTVAIEDGGPIHQALEGWSTLSSSWREEKPDELKTRQLSTKRHSNGTALYAHRSARVLWYPERSAVVSSGRPLHSLGCLHRNFTHASMQVLSLLGLARWAHQYINARGSLSFDSDEIVRNCAIVLGLLYGPVDDIYQSQTIRRQVTDSKLIDQINLLRHHYDPTWKDLTPP